MCSMFFYLHEFDHSSPKKTEASKLTANHVGLSSKKEKTEQDLFYSEFSRGNQNGRIGTIPILRQHIFGPFLTHPSTLRQHK